MTRRDFDQDVITIFLVVLAMGGLRLWARRSVMEGKDTGPTGPVAKALNILL